MTKRQINLASGKAENWYSKVPLRGMERWNAQSACYIGKGRLEHVVGGHATKRQGIGCAEVAASDASIFVVIK